MRLLQAAAATLFFLSSLLAQPKPVPAPDSPTDLPRLERFDVNIVDANVEPCDDFYKYACGKWLGTNPIPADRVAWGPAGRRQIVERDGTVGDSPESIRK